MSIVQHKKLLDAQLANLTITNGSTIYTTDTGKHFIDISDTERVQITDIIYIDTDSARAALLAPLPDKLYIPRDTSKVWIYSATTDKWVCLNPSYSAGSGLSLSGTTFTNSGVRAVTAGTSANQIKVNTGGTSTTITVNNVANATSASKATNDSAGQQINTTYIKGLSISGKVITYTKGDGTTGTITTQDNNTWRGIQNVLTSDSTTDSLSAAQGKALKTLVDGKADKATTLSGYGITDASISNGKITIGSNSITPLTSHQSLTAYAKTADVNTSLAKKADKATTLAGYGITDTSIANGVITIGANSITPLTSHQSLAAYAKTADMNTALAKKADKATTLSGYGITDASISNGKITIGANSITPLTSHQSLANYYTKTNVDNLISNLKAGLVNVVESLPTTGENGKLYLVKTGTEDQNLYTEYVYVNSAWEKLGTQKLDLSSYLTKTDAASTYLGKSANAVSATKLTTSAGNATQPIYFSDGKPVATTYSLGKSVPSNAVFTDTNNKATQTVVTDSDYTNYRPLVLGSSNSATKGFTPSTVTDGFIISKSLYVQPSTGMIHATTFEGSLSGTASNASKVNNLTVETAVPANAKFTDTVYTHPATHAASMITGLATVATSGKYSDLSGTPTSLPANGGTAAKLSTATAGSATQPVYFANGIPVATTYTLGASVPADAKFTDTNTWRGVQNNLTSTATDQSLAAAQGKYLNEHKTTQQNWTASIKCATWSRLCYIAAETSIIGSGFVLNVSGTRNNTVYNETFSISVNHSQKASIAKIGTANYSSIQLRVVSDSTGNCYVEIYDKANSATNTTTQSVYCRLVAIRTGAITTYTTFTDGSTLPTNFVSSASITTNGNSLQGNLTWSEITGKPNYAGSSSAGGSATSAVKLDTATAGSATQPVYFSGGKPVATTYTLGASVPSGAKFTDTVYTHPSTHPASMITGLATVATSGSYNDLSNKPTIPTIPSSLPANGGTATNANNVAINKTNPTTATTYYVPFAANNTGTLPIRGNDGFRYYTLEGTTSAVGQSQLGLGNNIASGTAGNKTGKLYMYGTGTGYTTLTTANASANSYTATLPAKDGTIAMTSDIPSSLPANGGTASSANKLNTNAGSATQPIYFTNGVPTACTYTLGASVPSDAKFTDTVYTLPDATASVKGGIKVGSNLTVSSGVLSLSKANVTAALGYTPPTTNTTYSNMTAATASAAGSAGLVPAPAAGKQTSFLRGDGTWVVPTNTTYSNMKAATADAAGGAGLVPAPAAGAQGLYLRGDGTWATPTNTTYGAATTSALGLIKVGSNLTVSSGVLSLSKANVTAALGYTPPTANTDTHYTTGLKVGASASATTNAAATNGNVYLNVLDNTTVRDSHNIVGSGATTVTSDANGKITISSTNTVYSHPSTHPASMITGLATVATSGKYSDLSGTPTLGSVASKGVLNNTTKGALGWADTTTSGNVVPTVNTIAYWNGAYDNTNSNLAYCNQGAFGSIVTKSTSDYATAGHTHNYAGSSSAGGVANSATKLATARTISLGTGATGSATSFDGSTNITIPVTAVRESYLSWGGQNFAGSFGCIDAAMVPDLGANRLAFGKAAGIKVEYSTDGGSTWADYGLTDAQKVGLFGVGSGATIGKASASTITTKCMLRVTVDTDAFGVYTALNKFVIYLSTNGCSGTYCTIEAALEETPTTFKVFADKISVSGWSGYNVINTSTIVTYGNTKNSQYGLIRFTFGCTAVNTSYSGLTISRIMGFGGVGWSTPSNMAKYGHLYSYDNSQNASFPAQITATQFNGALSGTASKATSDSAGQNINTTYIKALSISGKVITYTKGNGTTGTITTQDTNTTYSAGTGLALSGTTFSNSGVRSVTAGSTANIISVNTGGTTASITINNVTNATTASTLSLSNGTDDVARFVVFQSSGNSTSTLTACYGTDFKYNPVSNVLTVGSVSSANVVKALSISGKTITVTKGDGTTSTLTTQDTNTTYGAASSSTLGLVKTGSNITNSSGTISITKDNVIAALGYTPPTQDTNTDTKVTNTLATTTKAYVTGTTSATTNTGTQVFDTGVYLDTTAGTLVATKFKTSTGIEIY